MDYLKMSELYHHGIKGQKWGVRRFQYEDGSLTPEGKERYYKKLKEQLRDTTNKISFRNYSRYDNTVPRYMHENFNDNAIASYNKGVKLVEKMKKKGILSKDITYDTLRGEYEKEILKGYSVYRDFIKSSEKREPTEKDIEWYYFQKTLKNK